MRREELRLRDIIDAADFILRVVAPLTEEAFLQSELLQSAVLQKLIVIGEAAGNIPVDMQARYPAVRWRAMRGLRDIAVHAYHTVDWGIIWATVTADVPEMRAQVAAMWAAEYPRGPG